jgi:Zn-dependent protease
MARPRSIGTLHGSDLRLHWSWPLLPAGAAMYSLAVYPWRVALYSVLLILAAYICVLAHQWVQLLAARRFGLGTRDVTLYPFWGVARLTRLSERPWQENFIAATGPIVFGIIAAVVGAVLNAEGTSLGIPDPAAEPSMSLLLVHVFWSNILLAGLHLLPVLPLDGGRILRATLAMSTSRLRATEVAAVVTTLAAGLMILVAIVWLKSPLLGVTAVLLYFGAQEDLGTTRYFASLRHTAGDRPHPPAVLVPMDQILSPDCRPDEPNFSGFTWNAHARLWIEWREGQPVSANALIGDGQP